MNPALRHFIVIPIVSTLTIHGVCEPAFGQGRGNQGRGDRAAERGIALYHQRDYQAAVGALDTALAAGVSRYPLEQVYTILGNTLNELNRFEEAVSAHRKALEINPTFHEAWVNLGIVYRLKGDYEQAEICYLRALEIAPNYAELHASLGALYIFKDEAHKAVSSLERAIQLDRQLPVAHANLAIAYAMTGKFDAAESALRRAIVLGYRNGPKVRERIDALRATQKVRDP
ncbi:MAG TPA: tetratricopeptide repeat protein [Gemmatimonadales bacterium]|jgi:Flp pilus assembly protein TadD|nr:tetratricopeptide repeat protein [Gemmatimonadales bacterium]